MNGSFKIRGLCGNKIKSLGKLQIKVSKTVKLLKFRQDLSYLNCLFISDKSSYQAQRCPSAGENYL